MKKITFIALLIVTAAAFAGSQFTDNNDGTITDNVNSLVWQKCTAGLSGDNCESGSVQQYNWEGALSYCNGLGLGGRTWRLPNINELGSIVDYTKSNPAIDTTYFPGTLSSYYWSSSTFVYSTTYAWIVYFGNGGVSYSDKTDSYYVRCVSGP